MKLLRAGIVVVLACAVVTPAHAHWLRPQQVIVELRSPAVTAAYGVTSVARHPGVSRLLVLHVDGRWEHVAPRARQIAAEGWLDLWRHTVSQGIIAILEAGTDRSLVDFDANGRATLRDPGDYSDPAGPGASSRFSGAGGLHDAGAHDQR